MHFPDGGRLAQEFRRLGPGDPPEAIVAGLIGGSREGRDNPLEGSAIVQAAESERGLVIEMDDAFWSLDPDELRLAAAQIVFSVATLEEGKSVTLLDGAVPGDVPDARGRPLAQPLDRSDFPETAPWIEILQPVAGALVADPVPIDARTFDGRPWSVTFVIEGEAIPDRDPPIDVGSRTGDALAEFEVARPTGSVTVVVPVHVPDA